MQSKRKIVVMYNIIESMQQNIILIIMVTSYLKNNFVSGKRRGLGIRNTYPTRKFFFVFVLIKEGSSLFFLFYLFPMFETVITNSYYE